MGPLRPVVFLLLAAATPGTVGPASLRFDDVFGAQGEPAHLHYRAAYRSGGALHRLEVWRDGDRRIRRSTDDAITTFAVHGPRDAGYRLTVLDRKRRISTSIDRTNLYRIGQFSDWYDLAHGLRHPRGSYRLVRQPPPRQAPRTIAPCVWFALAQGGQTIRICWGDAARLPLAIAASDGRMLWHVEAMDAKPIAGSTFAVDDRGYTHIDADRDIAAD